MYKVSFVIPTRNRIEWLGECLQGALTQTIKEVEVVIVNDASDDGTKEFLDDWASQFPNVKIIHNETQKGGGRSRNIGMEAASADIICVGDDDDLVPTERAELAVKHFEEHPESEMVNYPYISIGYCNERLEEFEGEPFNHELFAKTGMANYFSNPTAAYKKKSAQEIGGYEAETKDKTDDVQFIAKWVKAGKKIDFDPRYFVNFHRILPKSMMVNQRGFDPKWVEQK